MGACRAAAFLALVVTGATSGAGAAHASAAYLYEYPRAPAMVELHPRGDRPFTLARLERALRLGVHAVELDLRWRASDAAVVCAHRSRDIAAAPSLRAALQAVRDHRGSAATVQDDGSQFFLFLDLKDESPPFHRALIRMLADHASELSTSGTRSSSPRGVTVVFTGFRVALEHTVSRAALDTLGIVEGRVYGSRMENLSGGDGRFQWVALTAPVERSRIQALHEGRDAALRGRFNVRVVAAHHLLRQAIRAGADAVNADPEEIESALQWLRFDR